MCNGEPCWAYEIRVVSTMRCCAMSNTDWTWSQSVCEQAMREL